MSSTDAIDGGAGTYDYFSDAGATVTDADFTRIVSLRRTTAKEQIPTLGTKAADSALATVTGGTDVDPSMLLILTKF